MTIVHRAQAIERHLDTNVFSNRAVCRMTV